MKKALALWLTLALLAGCAQHQPPNLAVAATTGSGGKTVQPPEEEFEKQPALIADPIEPVNRGIFWINHGLYFVVLRPISKGYQFIVPRPLREVVGNAFANIRFPVRLTNDLLQARFEDAGLETAKFLLNSTAGVGGLLRVSDKFPALAELPDADTAQTLARWGVPHGIYIVLPVLGPSSLRETVGIAGDTALNPITWIGFFFGGGFWEAPDWTIAIAGTQALSSLPARMDTYDAATEGALEKYISARTAWAQFREAKKQRALSRSEWHRKSSASAAED